MDNFLGIKWEPFSVRLLIIIEMLLNGNLEKNKIIRLTNLADMVLNELISLSYSIGQYNLELYSINKSFSDLENFLESYSVSLDKSQAEKYLKFFRDAKFVFSDTVRAAAWIGLENSKMDLALEVEKNINIENYISVIEQFMNEIDYEKLIFENNDASNKIFRYKFELEKFVYLMVANRRGYILINFWGKIEDFSKNLSLALRVKKYQDIYLNIFHEKIDSNHVYLQYILNNINDDNDWKKIFNNIIVLMDYLSSFKGKNFRLKTLHIIGHLKYLMNISMNSKCRSKKIQLLFEDWVGWISLTSNVKTKIVKECVVTAASLCAILETDS